MSEPSEKTPMHPMQELGKEDSEKVALSKSIRHKGALILADNKESNELPELEEFSGVGIS